MRKTDWRAAAVEAEKLGAMQAEIGRLRREGHTPINTEEEAVARTPSRISSS